MNEALYTGAVADKPNTLSGACYCRKVTFSVIDAFEYALICHCGECRRRTGGASKPFAAAPAATLTILEGRGNIQKLGSDDEHHASCSFCGSLIYSLVREGAYIHVPLGVLIDVPTLTPTAHIFVGSKAPWDVICDGLPQFEGFPQA